MKTSVAVLCATTAATLCQAFHIPASSGGSTSMSSRLRQQTHHQHRSPLDTLRRPDHAHQGSRRYRSHCVSVLASMSAAEGAIEVSSEVEEDAGEEGDEMEDDATVLAADVEKEIKVDLCTFMLKENTGLREPRVDEPSQVLRTSLLVF